MTAWALVEVVKTEKWGVEEELWGDAQMDS